MIDYVMHNAVEDHRYNIILWYLCHFGVLCALAQQISIHRVVIVGCLQDSDYRI